MAAYYNEIDPFAAQWLRNLIAAGYIAPGVVDERSVEDIKPRELNEFTQCHFFAGIGVWSLALRQAGWPDSKPVWTGSCPCQPFSAAGARAGFDDERHLWPAMFHLVEQCKPAVVFGEQVASKDAETWIDLVASDLEAVGYAFGAAAIASAGVGSYDIRKRAYWVGHTNDARLQGFGEFVQVDDAQRREISQRHVTTASVASPYWDWSAERGADGEFRFMPPRLGATANGSSARVGKLRAYGNAINAKAAQAFIECFIESPDKRY